jgi:hypothetical protein
MRISSISVIDKEVVFNGTNLPLQGYTCKATLRGIESERVRLENGQLKASWKYGIPYTPNAEKPILDCVEDETQVVIHVYCTLTVTYD